MNLNVKVNKLFCVQTLIIIFLFKSFVFSNNVEPICESMKWTKNQIFVIGPISITPARLYLGRCPWQFTSAQ